MSPNSILRHLRESQGISQAEVAFRLGCSISDIRYLEQEGNPVKGDVFLRLLKVYSTNVEEIINTLR